MSRNDKDDDTTAGVVETFFLIIIFLFTFSSDDAGFINIQVSKSNARVTL